MGEAACFADTLVEISWYLLWCCAAYLAVYAILTVIICMRAFFLWFYYNFCLGRNEEFDICAPDPLFCPREEEAATNEDRRWSVWLMMLVCWSIANKCGALRRRLCATRWHVFSCYSSRCWWTFSEECKRMSRAAWCERRRDHSRGCFVLFLLDTLLPIDVSGMYVSRCRSSSGAVSRTATFVFASFLRASYGGTKCMKCFCATMNKRWNIPLCFSFGGPSHLVDAGLASEGARRRRRRRPLVGSKEATVVAVPSSRWHGLHSPVLRFHVAVFPKRLMPF